MISFDNDKTALFNPYNLQLEGTPKKALMIFDDEVWEDYILSNKSQKILPVKNSRGRIFNNFRIINKNSENILLISPAMGSAGSATDMELLIASGIKTIVAFGTCGAMDKNIATNTIIIPTSALREEGVSYHYLPESDEIEQNKKCIETMQQVFAEEKMESTIGKIWTTDAVYRETKAKFEKLKKLGFIGVDMELASLLAVAKFRNINFAEFLISDDNIDGKPNKIIERNSKKLLDVAIKLLNRL